MANTTRTQYTTQSPAALERLCARYHGLFDADQAGVDADLVHGLYAELGASEASVAAGEAKVAGERTWACPQDRLAGLFAAIGASVYKDASPAEKAYLDRQRGTSFEADSAEVAESVDWTPAESPSERRARNWAARAGR